jgi:hypothetical protein
MLRTTWALVTLVCLAIPGTTSSADPAPAGNWKVTFLEQTRQGPEYTTFCIIKLEPKEGKWTASLVAKSQFIPRNAKVEIEGMSVTGDQVQFSLKMLGQTFTFQGKVPAEPGARILGSFAQGSAVAPAYLDATKLETLDPFDVLKDKLNQTTDPELFHSAMVLLSQASTRHVKPEEVRGWVNKVFKAAEAYGPRWQREMALRMADVLLVQEPFTSVALEMARKAERMLDAKDTVTLQVRTLTLLAKALTRAKKDDEAKEVEARIARLNIGVKPEPYAGRKAKSERTVLVELFSGSQCPPCVAADLAFDGLLKTYKPTDVVLVQYHIHVPSVDPLTCPVGEERFAYYEQFFRDELGDDVRGAPVCYVSGKPELGGGSFDQATEKYKAYRTAIDALLEKPSPIKLKATVTRKGNKVNISADVSGVEKPAESVRLRLLLVEEQVNYVGSNNIRVHRHLVRDMPGGTRGVAVKEKTGKLTATVDLGELRNDLNKYLDAVAKEAPFPNKDRPLELKQLRVIAFVQDDKTREVLQAVEVKVPGEGEAE